MHRIALVDFRRTIIVNKEVHMIADYPPLEVRVWGDFACFTRPEMKVERVSYPVPTPSAARGILESIFRRPQFKWRVEEIRVLNPIRYFSILRNEVNSKASHRSASSWEKHVGTLSRRRMFQPFGTLLYLPVTPTW